jgi:hypothetical protein
MLIECLLALGRRWIWAFVALVLAVSSGIGTFVSVPPVQDAQSQILFLPSRKQPGVPGLTNPFLNLGGSVAIVATAVRISVDSDVVHKEIFDSGNTGKYKIVNNLSENAGPTLIVTVEDTSAKVALSTLDAVIREIAATLDALQEQQGVDRDLFVSSLPLTRPITPTVERKKQIQFAVLVFGGSLALLLAGILMLDRRLSRTVRRGVSSTTNEEDTSKTSR